MVPISIATWDTVDPSCAAAGTDTSKHNTAAMVSMNFWVFTLTPPAGPSPRRKDLQINLLQNISGDLINYHRKLIVTSIRYWHYSLLAGCIFDILLSAYS
jgi:hypothetical protein